MCSYYWCDLGAAESDARGGGGFFFAPFGWSSVLDPYSEKVTLSVFIQVELGIRNGLASTLELDGQERL